MRVAVLAGVVLVALGCATDPVTFSIDVAGPTAADAIVRKLGATTDTEPLACRTPCEVTFEYDTAYEVELREPGWQRARLPIDYVVIFQHQLVNGEENLRLRIPMLPREPGSPE